MCARRDAWHVATGAAGEILRPADLLGRCRPRVVASGASLAVVGRVPPHAFVRIVAGNAGQCSGALSKTLATREKRRLVANVPDRIPVEISRGGTVTGPAKAVEIVRRK